MTTFFRGACASAVLGAGVVLAGCGGGGSNTARPTPTPGPNGTPTATPTATSNGSGPITSGQLVFVSTRSGSSEIYKANLDGSNAVQLTSIGKTMGLPIEKPSVSPDGRRIVFQFGRPRDTSGTGSATDNLEIAVINTDGTGFRQLTTDDTPAGRPDDYNPVFSADSRFIFWTSERSVGNVDRVPHIFRMNGAPGDAGSNPIQLVAEPSLSPSVDRTGRSLAFIARSRTTSPIIIQPLTLANTLTGTASAIGGNVSGGSAFNLALSPDGSRVAFSTVQGTMSNGNTGATTSTAANLNILSVATGASVGAASGGTSNGGAAWSRDSQTLYFDAAGQTANRQIFALAAPFSGAPRAVTTDAQGANFSPSFLSGG